MIFSSFTFLLLFMPCVLLTYRVLPARARMPFLLAASLLFYGWGNPVWLLLILFSMVLNWGGVLVMTRKGKPSRAVLVCLLVMNLLPLLWFKYSGFLADTWTRLTGMGTGFQAPMLPAGISFFTFQAMSYVIDVYRGEAKPQKNLILFSVYLSLFPQLVAGPIVRYTDLEAQLTAAAEAGLFPDAGRTAPLLHGTGEEGASGGCHGPVMGQHERGLRPGGGPGSMGGPAGLLLPDLL